MSASPSVAPKAPATRASLWLASLSAQEDIAQPHSRRVVAGSGRSLNLLTEAVGPDLSTGAHGGCGAIFDGVLYNRGVLRSRLAADASLSDAELVVRAYLRWGPEMLSYLQGIFALCVWDSVSKTFFCARDRVGIYPLFYIEDKGEFSVSTSIEALQGLSRSSAVLNRELLVAYVARQTPGLAETFFKNIERLPPGHALHLNLGRRNVYRYWQPAAPGAGAPWVREDELSCFSDLLDQAVGRALDRGPAGIFLSGGLDSVSVAAVAAEHSARRGLPQPWALSLAFPGDVSEVEVQQGVAGDLGLSQVMLPFSEALGGQSLMDAALAFSSTWSAPLQNVWLPAYHSLGECGRERGCEVILTGGGGDEWLTVTPLFAADMIRSLDPVGVVRYIGALQRSLNLPRLPLLRNVLWSNGARPLLQDSYRSLFGRLAPGAWEARVGRGLAARVQKLPAWVAPAPELRRSLESRLAAHAFKAAQSGLPGPGGYYYREMQTGLDHPLFALDIEEIFESGRRTGLQEYNIYWDADLIEFLYRVPPHLLNKGGRSKGLVREELARRFPQLGFDRQKKLVSLNFFRSTVLREGKAAWDSLGGAFALADLGVVEPSILSRRIDDVFATQDAAWVDQLWYILSLETWVRSRL